MYTSEGARKNNKEIENELKLEKKKGKGKRPTPALQPSPACPHWQA